MIKCTVVTTRQGYLWIESADGQKCCLQADYDIAAFAVDCGAVKAPQDWDGLPSSLDDSWLDVDLDDIAECPEAYFDNCFNYPED